MTRYLTYYSAAFSAMRDTEQDSSSDKARMRSYKVVDVFTSVPFKGNPVAVILDAEGLSDADMQAIAGWTNLSETTFVLPATEAGADYRLRIFTPRSEIAFAGHPTLGSAHAMLEAGRATPRDGVLVQQCRKGLVRIAVEGDGTGRRLTLELPPATITPLEPADVEELEAILGAPLNRTAAPAIVDVGLAWVLAQVADADTLLALQPDFGRMAKFERRLKADGVTLFGNHLSGDAAIEVRSFAPADSVDEDPVCGSGNGCVAVFRHHHGLVGAGSYVAAQGQKLGRNGRIHHTVMESGQVKIGGTAVTCVDGKLFG